MINESAFPTKKMKLKLKKAEPSRLKVEVLKKQLNDLGLRCEDTSIESLTLYKSQVMQSLPSTKMQVCQIAKPKNGFSEAAFRTGKLGESDAPYIEEALQLENAATGEWIWDVTAAGYQMELTSIQVPAHFDYLMKNRPYFAGLTAEEKVNKQLTSVDAIKGLFIQTAETASSTLGKSLNKDSVEAFYSNVISNLNESDVKSDYERSDSRILFMTLNYNEEAEMCDGIGVINVSWNIKIKNYQRKTKNGGDYHDTTIDVFCRGAFYSDPAVLEGDYDAVKSAFKDARCLMQYPKEPIAVSVFETLPPANRESFWSGLPGTVTDTYTDSIILHSPYWKEHHHVLGISAKNCTISAAKPPVSEISYVTDDEHAVPLELTDQENVSETLAFQEPVSLKQVVYKAEILRHNLLDGSYQYVESGEYESSHYIAI